MYRDINILYFNARAPLHDVGMAMVLVWMLVYKYHSLMLIIQPEVYHLDLHLLLLLLMHAP